MPRAQNSLKGMLQQREAEAAPPPGLPRPDHPDVASAVPPGLAARVGRDPFAVADHEPEALVVVLPHLPPLVERQGTEAPLVGEGLSDGIVEFARVLLAERIGDQASVGSRAEGSSSSSIAISQWRRASR